MNLTPFGETIASIIVASLITALGWLIQSQIKTNRELAKAITNAVMEWKVAIEMISQRDEKQKTVCELYRSQMGERCKWMDIEIREIKDKVEKITEK